MGSALHYLADCRPSRPKRTVSSGRRQKAEGRRQKAEGRRQKAEGGLSLAMPKGRQKIQFKIQNSLTSQLPQFPNDSMLQHPNLTPQLLNAPTPQPPIQNPKSKIQNHP